MHDVLHDIACAISNPQKMESNPDNLSGKSARKLRTLIFDVEGIRYKVWDDFVCLRVLKLGWHSVNWQISMDKLKHLRYLDISDYPLDALPLEHICLLYNLQTLKFGSLSRGLPKNLSKLVNLRHLYSWGDWSGVKKMPSHMGKLIHLQTLPKFLVGLEKGCKIEELGPLKDLKGVLRLEKLEKVQNKEEAMTAKLVEKKDLRHLFLQWSTFSEGEEYDEYNNVQVLEGLQPHKNLQSLNIYDFKGEVLPNGIFVENLVEIILCDCHKCGVLPMLGQLPNLKKLKILSMESVRSIGNEFYGIDSKKTNSFAFPQLKELSINGMNNLEKWDDELITSNLFGSLEKVTIFACDKLTKLPSGLEGCHSIEKLEIDQCPNLILNVQNLHNLYHLDIGDFNIAFREGLSRLTNLKKLMITGCMEDDESSDNATTQLPQQLQHLTNLKVLEIEKFDGIEILPEWLGNFTSLRALWFSDCKNFKKLPSKEAMLRLTKLEYLEYDRCPKLLLGEGDEERAKLSHLPSICVRKGRVMKPWDTFDEL